MPARASVSASRSIRARRALEVVTAAAVAAEIETPGSGAALLGGGGEGGPLPENIEGLPPRVDNVEERLTVVEDALNITPPDPTWTEPPLLGTFGTTDAALAAGHPKFGYKLLEDGITLLLRGRIDKGYGSTNGNRVIALPFVPFNHQDAFFWRSPPTYTDGPMANAGYLRSDGTIDLNISNGGSWIDLDGLGFSVVAA